MVMIWGLLGAFHWVCTLRRKRGQLLEVTGCMLTVVSVTVGESTVTEWTPFQLADRKQFLVLVLAQQHNTTHYDLG